MRTQNLSCEVGLRTPAASDGDDGANSLTKIVKGIGQNPASSEYSDDRYVRIQLSQSMVAAFEMLATGQKVIEDRNSLWLRLNVTVRIDFKDLK